MKMILKRRLFLLFIMGAVIGSVLDSFHVYGGAAYYAKPMALGISLWTPLILGIATVVIGFTHCLIHPVIWKLKPAVITSVILFIIAYWVSAFYAGSNMEKAIIILLLYLLGWGLYDRTWESLILATVTALIGSAVEGILGFVGFFIYTRPDYLYIPIWLLPLYANASAACGNLGRYFLSKKVMIVNV